MLSQTDLALLHYKVGWVNWDGKYVKGGMLRAPTELLVINVAQGTEEKEPCN